MDSKYGSSAGVCLYRRCESHVWPHLGQGRGRGLARKTAEIAAVLVDLKTRREKLGGFMLRVGYNELPYPY